MCCRGGRSLWLTALAVGLMSLSGCGRPAGTMFPAIEPALVWPGAPEPPRIRWVGSITDSGDLKASVSGGEVLMAALRGDRPPITFTNPHGVAMRGSTMLAVADGGAGAVHLIDMEGRTHRVVFGHEGERFGAPVGVAWVDDHVYVTDAERNEVIVIDGDGRWFARFGHDVLDRPVGIVFAQTNEKLYVANGNGHNIVVFDRSGCVVETIGSRGLEPGLFNWPSHLCVRNDRLYVTDSGNARVQILNLQGTPVSMIGQRGSAAGSLALPKGVAIDSEGHVYVVDARFENVQIFDGEGRLLLAFGQEGADRGSFSLPAGIAIDERDRIWIADSGNRRIQVFEYLRAS